MSDLREDVARALGNDDRRQRLRRPRSGSGRLARDDRRPACLIDARRAPCHDGGAAARKDTHSNIGQPRHSQ